MRRPIALGCVAMLLLVELAAPPAAPAAVLGDPGGAVLGKGAEHDVAPRDAAARLGADLGLTVNDVAELDSLLRPPPGD